MASLYSKAKSLVKPLDNEKDALDAKQKSINEYVPSQLQRASFGMPEATAPMDRVGQATRPEEQRINTKEMTKPLGEVSVYDSGGAVNDPSRQGKRHQLAVLEEGERVLSPNETAELKKQSHGFPKSDLPQVTSELSGVNPPLLPVMDAGGSVDSSVEASVEQPGSDTSMWNKVKTGMSKIASAPTMPDEATMKRKANAASIMSSPDPGDVRTGIPVMDEGGEVESTDAEVPAAGLGKIEMPAELTNQDAMQRNLAPQSMQNEDAMRMRPLGNEKPSSEELHAKIDDHMVKAAAGDDIVALGKGAVAKNQLNKHDALTTSLDENGLPRSLTAGAKPTALPTIAPPAGSEGWNDALRADAGLPKTANDNPVLPTMPKATDKTLYSDREAELKAKITDPKSTPVESAQAEVQLQQLRQNRPWDTRSGLSKLGHIAEAFLPTAIRENIPGSADYLTTKRGDAEKSLAGAEENAVKAEAVSGAPAKLAGQLLLKGYALQKNATGEMELQEVPGFRDASKDMQSLLASRTQDAIDSGRDPMTDPKVQAITDVMQSLQKIGAPSQETNKLAAQATVSKMAKAGYKTDPANLSESIRAALHKGDITAQEAADYRGYAAVNPNAATNLQVTVAGAEAKENIRKADKSFAYTDAEGNTQLATGDKVPKDAEGVIPIPDVKAFMNSADNTNLVQKTFTNLYKDNMKVFDNPAARAVLATALDEGHAAQAGILVAGTGGTLTLPTGTGKIIDQLLENNAVPKNLQRDVKDIIVDTWLTKDKLISLQMAIQNDKLGRGQQAVIQAMYNQLPGSGTADSLMAKRALNGVQTMIDSVKGRYPEKYGRYEKEPSPNAGETKGATSAPTGATKVYKDKDGVIQGYAVNGAYVPAKQ